MQKEFKSGDPVKLKSGNQKKHVLGYDENGKVVCAWETTNGEKREEAYYEFELEKWPIRRHYGFNTNK